MRYYNRTAAQKKMLDFARQYLQADDEVGDSPGLGHFWVLLGPSLRGPIPEGAIAGA